MGESELKTALEEVQKAKIEHPEADRIEWSGNFVRVTYNIYPEGWLTEPF